MMSKKTTFLSGLLMSASLFSATGSFAQAFFETMGDATGASAANNNAVSFWEGQDRFDNDALTMTGTVDNTQIRNISDVQGNHAFISRNGGFFTISGINTVGLSNMQLSFKLLRGAGNPTQFPVGNFKVEVSTNGTSWTLLGSAHSAGAGVWQAITATGTLPQAANLRIRFSQPAYAVSSSTNNYFYRIDDVRLVVPCAPVTLSGVTSDVSCNGGSNGSIDLSVTGSGSIAYSWSNGSSSQDLSGLSAGTYTVTATNACSNASLSFTISQPEPLVAAATTSDYNGWGVSCNGFSNGFVAVSASGGTPPYSGTLTYANLAAGTYSYPVVDANGCVASTSATITQPEVLTADAGGDETVFSGYGPMECADLSANAAGGTPDYNYVWTSNGSGGAVGADVTVCPEANEVYTLSVTDANGCTASDQLSICAVNVECEAGNSGNMKVEMCQIPPGNPANAHTICVDENAVPAHLAIGCTLGACGELDQCNNLPGMAVQGAEAQKFEALNPALALTAYPNPTNAATTVSVTPVDKGEYTIVLTDMTGRVIAELFSGFISDYENRTFDVEMSSLTGGIYVVNVIGSNGIMDNLRIVKE